MKKYTFFFILFLILSCNTDKITDGIIDNVYYSTKQENTINCTTIYHFKKDSMISYDFSKRLLETFKITYNYDNIKLDNGDVFRVYFDGINFSLLRGKTNDTLKLNKANVNPDKKPIIKNILYYKTGIKNSVIADTLWINFNDSNKIYRYNRTLETNDLNYFKSNYWSQELSNKLRILYFEFENTYFLVLNDSESKKSLLPIGCHNNSNKQIDYHRYESTTTNNKLINEWNKIESINEYDFPQKLVIENDIAFLDGEEVKYETGLNTELLILEKYKKTAINGRIIKLTNDTLIISALNSIKELERAVYKRVDK
jgi:hypothetical protein